jgi:V/A-type H+-transporting ATPase subunit I
MAISKMKKLTLLAEKEHFEDVMISLQSSQSVEVIPISSAIQRNLVSQYYDDNEVEDLEDSSEDEVFELKTRTNEINHLTNNLDRIEGAIEFLEDTLPSPGFFAQFTQEKESYSLYEIEEYMENKDVNSLIQQSDQLKEHINQITNEKEKLEREQAFLNRWRFLDFNPKETKDFQMTKVVVGAINSERNDELREELDHFDEIYIEEIHYSEEETMYLIVTAASQAHDVEQTLIKNRFERLNYDYEQLPKEELKRNKQDLNEIDERIAKLKKIQKNMINYLKI